MKQQKAARPAWYQQSRIDMRRRRSCSAWGFVGYAIGGFWISQKGPQDLVGAASTAFARASRLWHRRLSPKGGRMPPQPKRRGDAALVVRSKPADCRQHQCRCQRRFEADPGWRRTGNLELTHLLL
jgi:hypothetical protein